ncbi:MAG: hypothetical protein ACTSVV_02070 [Promethearchaeota archaeon]
MNHKRVINITDRRSGKKSAPHVPSKGGAQPRSRTKSGRWRKKRSDAKGSYKYPKPKKSKNRK